MDDQEIIDRFWARNESAITAVNDKYHAYCRSIAIHILGNAQDAEEVVNDTYHRVWNAIPPTRPESLRAFVGKITRNLSIDKLNKVKAKKRGEGQVNILLSELEEVIPSGRDFEDEMIETEEITAAINDFLAQQSVANRRIFVRRYWQASGIEEIAHDFEMSVGQVKSTLFRMRKKLRKHLESEGIPI